MDGFEQFMTGRVICGVAMVGRKYGSDRGGDW